MNRWLPCIAFVALLCLPLRTNARSDEMEVIQSIRQRILEELDATEASQMRPYTESIPGSDVSFEMVPIRAGDFRIGSPADEAGRRDDEGPQRGVSIDAFWMGRHEVTWDEYDLFTFPKEEVEVSGQADAVTRPTKPFVDMSFGMGRRGFPAISMTQYAARKYSQWLSAMTGRYYRLPTEAEWEYACRAGTAPAYSFGNGSAELGQYAWYRGNSDGKYHPIGVKEPNPWGLYDMHGNVIEWTLDQYAPDRYQRLTEGILNPWLKPSRLFPHVVRGGSWADGADALRCAARRGSDPSWQIQDPQLPKSVWYHTDAPWVGLRLVRPLEVPSVEEMYEAWHGSN